VSKRVLVFSLGPVFPEHVHGGSQKVLRDVALYLGRRGHAVNIYCVERRDNAEPFALGPNVTVWPHLRFKETFPSSYKAAPHDLSDIAVLLHSEIQKHDVFYIHDSGMNFSFLCEQRLPTVLSLRDFIYPETLVGAFNFSRDRIIVNSDMTKDCVRCTVGRFLPGVTERIRVIPNGIDTSRFSRTRIETICDLIGLGVEPRDHILLCPHRPESRKGVFEALDLVARLRNRHGMLGVKLLIPDYVDRPLNRDLEGHCTRIETSARELGVSENVVLHRWVPHQLMPEYYSLGSVTLCLGNFIEAFGPNVCLESLACGTPVVLSRVGAQRTTLPEGITPKVDYGDLDTVERVVMDLLLRRELVFDEHAAREFVEKHFAYEKMLSAYEEALCSVQVLPGLERFPERAASTHPRYSLAPWCCMTGRGVYHDYHYGYEQIDAAVRTLLAVRQSFSLQDAGGFGVEQEDIRALLKRGILVEELSGDG